MNTLESEMALAQHQARLAEIHYALDRIPDSPMELSARLNAITQVIRLQLRCDVCSIYVLDPDGRVLTLKASYGLSPSAVGRARLQVGEGVTGWVAEHLEAVALADAQADERFKYLPDTGEMSFRSLLSVPIVADRSFVGVINVQHREVHTFSEPERLLVAAIGYKVGAMIRSAIQDEELRSHQLGLDLFLSATGMIHAGRKDGLLLPTLLAKARRATCASGAVLRRRHPKTGRLEVVHLDGAQAVPEAFGPLKKGEGVAGEVAETGRSLRLNDFPVLAEKMAAVGVISSSLMCVPLEGAKGVLGTLSVFDKAEGPGGVGFSLYDKQLLEGLAQLIGMAWMQAVPEPV